MFDKIKRWFALGLWSRNMVLHAVDKGVLTQEQAGEILGA